MKKVFFLMLACILSFTIAFSGCSHEAKGSTQYTTPLYSITVEDGQYYLTPTTDLSSVDARQALIYPKFSTVSEMRQGIISGSFTEENLYALSRSSANADGTIDICDLDDLYECTVPSELGTKNIVWCGKYYYFNLINISGRSVWGSIRCCDEDTFINNFSKEYMGFLSNPNATLTRQEEIDERSATIYYTTTATNAKLKYICYEIQEGDKHIFIQEEYLLEIEHDLLKTSSTVPLSISYWGTDGSGHFYGHLHDLSERPSVEWLSQFGLTPSAT